jgi:hypothetical protein
MSEDSAAEFVSRNSGFLLTLAGVFTACCGGFLGFILKSRCTKIECCCVKFERDVINLTNTDPKATEVQMSSSNNNTV